MKPSDPTTAELRTLASLSAASIAVLICLHQRHFTLSASDPSSFLTMTHHRCGLVLLGSVTWCLIETANLFFRDRTRQQLLGVRHG